MNHLEVNVVSLEENTGSRACAYNKTTNAGSKKASIWCLQLRKRRYQSPPKILVFTGKGKEVAIYLTDKKQLRAEVGMVDERHRMSCMVNILTTRFDN